MLVRRLDDAAGRVRGPRLPGRLGLARLHRDRGRSAATALPPGLRQGDPLPRADLHPGHEGQRGTRREHHARARRPTWSAAGAGRAPSGITLALYARAAERCAPRRDHPRRHQVRAGARPRGAGWCWATRRSPPTRRACGRPTGGSPGRARPPSTSSTCATGSTGSAGTTPRRRPSCRREVVEGTRGRYRGGPRAHHGGGAGDPGGGDGDAEGRGPRPPGPGGGRALAQLGFAGVGEVRIGKRIELAIDGRRPGRPGPRDVRELLANALIEDYRVEVAG